MTDKNKNLFMFHSFKIFTKIRKEYKCCHSNLTKSHKTDEKCLWHTFRYKIGEAFDERRCKLKCITIK